MQRVSGSSSKRWYGASRLFAWLLIVSAVVFLFTSFFALTMPAGEPEPPVPTQTAPVPDESSPATELPVPDEQALPTPDQSRPYPSEVEAPPPARGGWDLAQLGLILSAATFILSAVGTASTVLLGWRNDRRQSKEFRLKIEQLEVQLAQARSDSISSESSN